MKVYVAGPYTNGDVAANVANAIRAANKILDAGHTPFVPHLFHFWHLVYPRRYEDWTAMDMEWLKFCDVIVRLPGESRGADMEVAWAKSKKMAVYNLGEFLASVSIGGL